MRIIAAVSDTHIDDPEKEIPEKLIERLEGVDLILHAGDITHESVLDRLSITAPIEAVRGNMDVYPSLQHLSLKRVITVDRVKIGLSHGGGSPVDIRDRLYRSFRDDQVDVIVFGHTHHPIVEKRKGILWVNPGSATGRYPAAEPTFALIRVKDDNSVSAEIIRLSD